MHLISIKIAGFKSFADPVTIHVPRALSGIVGPNGSGKSNVVDALRWVIGESSAKSLRGGTLDDVIFSGSAKRKPAGQASVELLFDNSLSRCGGQWEKYAEISIRRTVSRDGLSEYFINGTRTRRRDVKELFLGTGFGPRSYSIIEQGMISRIVEGKPENLSEFIEEASGVSRFREKRHETVLKLKQVASNLERLDDMRHEIDKRIRQLKYQADQARRYTLQKEKLEGLRIKLLGYSWKEVNQKVSAIEDAKSELDLELEKYTARVRTVEADLEEKREKRLELESTMNDVQKELVLIGVSISDSERRIENVTQEVERTKQDIQAKTELLGETEKSIVEQTEKAKYAADEHDKKQALLTDSKAILEDQQSQLEQEDNQQTAIQNEAENADQLVIDAVRRRESVFAALEQNRQNLAETSDTLNSVASEISQLKAKSAQDSRENSNQQLDSVASDCDTLRSAIDQLESNLTACRTEIDQHSVELDGLRENARETRVQLGSIERSLSAMETEDDEQFSNWLSEHNLSDTNQLFQSVTVSKGWERAVDCVLGEKLNAICVDDLDSVAKTVDGGQFSKQRYFINGGKKVASNENLEALASYVESPNQSAETLLAGVYTANSLAAALSMQDQLGANECVVTADGSMVGVNWFSPSAGDRESKGQLETANLIRDLRLSVDEFDVAEAKKKKLIDDLRIKVSEYESQLGQKRQEIALKIGELEQLRSELKDSEVERLKIETKLNEMVDYQRQLKNNRARLESEQTEFNRELAVENEALSIAESKKADLSTKSKTQAEKLKKLQDGVSDAVRKCYQLELEAQKFSADHNLAKSSLIDLQQRQSEIRGELKALETDLATAGDPTLELKATLNDLVQQERAAEERRAQVRNQIEEVESDRRQLDETRMQAQHEVGDINLKLQQQNIELGRLSAQSEDIKQQISDRNADAAEVSNSLDDEFSYEETTAKFERLERKIENIGSVNLVAVEQYEQEQERKSYMDSQYDDLTRAMETLQNTIKKIDKESQERYNETFAAVNSEFQRLIPKLFGGGSGHLELTGEYPDDAGLKIYARPKGKRIHHIQALSGGEKALTAVALILSMFQLNPSPVCLLDEVDAPLDDDNVYRLCDSLHALSDNTQMILITHNKITMESVDTLIGVTMPEPNVSRILSVDLLEAQEFAA